MEVPGEEFYYARVRKTQQVPAHQRSPDVVAFLEAHQLLEEAAAGLGLLGGGGGSASTSGAGSSASASSSSTSQGPALARSEAEQLEAVLVMLAGTYLVPPLPLQHPALVRLCRDPFIALVRPLMETTSHVEGSAAFLTTPLLQQLVGAGAPPVQDWQLLARLLLVLYMLSGGKPNLPPLVPAVAQAVINCLLDEGPVHAFGRQLQQVQQGSRWGARLPSLEQLRITALIMACTSVVGVRSSIPAELRSLQQQREAWARQLMAEQPSHPRSHQLLITAFLGGPIDPHTLEAERPGLARTMVALEEQHCRHSLALAREQGSDVWRAILAYELATGSMTCLPSAVDPAEVEELWCEGRAARQRCKACLPQDWLREVNGMHQYMKSMQSALDEHLRLSPGRWGGAGLATMRRGEVQAALSQADARFNEGVSAKCDGCGQPSLALKRCSACQQASYCRWV